MGNDTSPSVLFAQRLDAIEKEKALKRFIAMADDAFKNPTDIIPARWERPEGVFIFSRPAHEFSEYEKFVFRLALIQAGTKEISREIATALVAATVYAGGKCKIEGTALGDIDNYIAVLSLVKSGSEHFVPKPLSAYANDISGWVAGHYANGTSPSLTKWLSLHVPKPAGLADDTSVLFSENPSPYALPLGSLNANARTLYYIGETSLLTVAPSGKGKTQCHVLPALAHYRGPAIVLDIKGECYEQTSAWRRQNVGPVFRFNPVNPQESDRYNPLAFVDDDPDELWESSRFLADLLVVTSSKNDPVWENQGRDLVTLIIAFVTAINKPHKRTMSQVLDLVATVGLDQMLASLTAPESPFPSAMRRVAARMRQMYQNAPKQFEGVLSGASQHLQLWEGPKLERVTSACDWAPEQFKQAPFPTLYLCIPANAIDTYAPVLRVIIGQHVRRLMRSQQKAEAPVLFLLDELPRLGKMAPIREALEVGRSYGIKLWMIAQYPEQLTSAYGEVGEGMMEACDVRMYMNPTTATAERLARAFGKSVNVLDGSKTQVVESLDILGPGHRDSIFVLAANETPRVLSKRYFFRNQS